MPSPISSRANFLHFSGAKRLLKTRSAEYVFFNKNSNKYIDGKDYDEIERSMNDCGLLKNPSAIDRLHTDIAKQKHTKVIALVSIEKTRKLCIIMEVLTCRGR